MNNPAIASKLLVARSEKHLLLALCCFSAVWVSFLVLRYSWIFGGDPEIHIIFARNLLDGHFLEFNPGYQSGGETSPLYMLLVAGGYELFGRYVPYAMKAVSYASLATICLLIYRANFIASRLHRLAIALLSVCMPFFVFQASLAMENMLFAAVVLVLIHLWMHGRRGFVVLAPVFLPLLFLLRPEAIFLALWLGCACLAQRDVKAALAVGVAVAITCGAYLILNHYGGGEAQNAGLIRAYLSSLDAVRVTILGHEAFVSLKVLKGLAYAAPILAYMAFRYRQLRSSDWIMLGSLFALPAVLHLFTVFPNTQFSRYFLFEYAVLLYAFAAKFLPTIEPRILAALWVFVLLVAVVEVRQRESLGSQHVGDSISSFAPDSIRAYSDSLFSALQPERLPVVIATGEVQLRGRLDDRFVVWSLDGITDRKLSHHLYNGYLDHFAYLKERNIAFVVGLPNYNRDSSKPSLADFAVPPGVPIPCIRGLKLTPTLATNIYRVMQCADRLAAAEPGH